MSSKTRTRTTRTTTTSTTRTQRSASDQPTTAPVRTDTEDKLWAALHANPNSTATDLCAAAKIGKSTAQKILVKWAGEGSVTRVAGQADGGRRAADVWATAETNTANVPSDESTVTATDTTQDEPNTRPADQQQADSTDATPAEGKLAEPVNAEPTATPTSDDSQDTPDDPVPANAGPTDAEPASTEATNSTDNAAQSATNEPKDPKADRLAPGALRGMVEDWLRDHPGEQAGPTTIAKDLGGKSSGAVSNALDKLAEDGVAVKTQDKPRRFALAPTEQVAAAAPAN